MARRPKAQFRVLLALALCSIVGLREAAARGQTAAAASVPAASALPRADDRLSARTRFLEGMALSKDGHWELALDAFRESIALHPSRAAAKNVAICLERLGRLDEALEVLQALILQYPQFSPDEREAYDAKLYELGRKLGAVEIRIPDPGWKVAIDGRHRGVTPLPGLLRLTPGPHSVRMSPPGAAPFEEPVDIVAGGTAILYIKMAGFGVASNPDRPRASKEKIVGVGVSSTREPEPSRDADTPFTRFDIGLRGGLGLGRFGGEVAGCSGCNRGFGVGGQILLQGGYRVADRVRISLDVGYWSVTQTVQGRTLSIFAPSVETVGVSTDALTLSGELVGVSAEYQPSTTWPLRVRAGGGAFVGGMRDERTADFVATTQAGCAAANAPSCRYSVRAWQRPAAESIYGSLGVDAGFRPLPRVYLGVGVDVWILVAVRQPAWNSDVSVGADQGATEGESWFAGQSLSGKLILLWMPSLAARYEF